MASSSAEMARCTSFLTMSSYSCLTTVRSSLQHRPHGRHRVRMRRDVLAANPLWVVILVVNLHFLGEPRDVRDVDFDRAVAQCLHELVVQKLLVLGLVGVADDDLVDVGLRELL